MQPGTIHHPIGTDSTNQLHPECKAATTRTCTLKQQATKSRHQLATMGRRRRVWAGLGWQDRPQAPAEPLSHSSRDLHSPLTTSQRHEAVTRLSGHLS